MNHTTDKDFLVPQMVTQISNEQGQSAIEFVLVIGFALGVTFLFITQTFNTTRGYLLHYANFAASRVYLTADNGSNEANGNLAFAAARANEQLDSFNLSSAFGIEVDCDFKNYVNTNALFTGSVCEFEATTNFLPLIGGGDKAKLVSESFLGREPTRLNCYEMTCEAIYGERTGCAAKTTTTDFTLYDNGC